MSVVRVAGLALLVLAVLTGQGFASRTTDAPAAAKQARPALPIVACRAGESWFGGGVFAVYGRRGGRIGVIDVQYVDAGCYLEF